MADSDYVIDNQSAPAFRADLNNVLAAIVTNNSKATEPANTYAHMIWVDTTANEMKMRNKADTAWITLGRFNFTNDRWEPVADVRRAASSSGMTFLNSSGTELLTISNTGLMTLKGGLVGGGNDLTKIGTVSMTEQAAANPDVAGDGQIWVKTATPNELWFTDDAGNDVQIGKPSPVKAWVNFNGTGTVTINAGYNVSSITDNGIGDYTINFTSAIADANYAAVFTAGDASDGRASVSFNDDTARTASLIRIQVINHGNALRLDPARVNMVVTR